MPITRELSPEELKVLDDQGIDSREYAGKKVTLLTDDDIAQQAQAQPTSNQVTQPSLGRAILDTQKARVGGTLGGGGGAIAGGEAGAGLGALVPPPFDIATVPIGALIGAGIGAYGGGYLGQKGQNALQGQELTSKLEQEAQVGEQAYPKSTAAADIVTSALASGGKFNLSNISRALSSDTGALGKIALNAVVNPAINTGIGYAATGQLPTAKDLATQAIGGSLFSEQAGWANRLTGHISQSSEPTANINDSQPTTPGDITSQSGESMNIPSSPFQVTRDDGSHAIDNAAIKQAYAKVINPKPDTTGMSDVDSYKAMSDYRRNAKVDVDTMRNALHDKWVNDYASANQAQTLQTALITTSEIPDVLKGVPDNAIGGNIPTDIAQNEPMAKVTTASETTPIGQVEDNLKADDNAPITEDEANELLKASGMNEAPPFPNEDDRTSYEQKYSKMKDMISKGDTSSPEFMQDWKELESLKNKNGGMPPISNQTDTPEFKKWFGNSKIVDSEDKPLVVYHGTQKAGFDIFYPESHFGDVAQANDILKGDKKTYRDNRAKQYPPEIFPGMWRDNPTIGINDAIYPIYLKIENPKRVSDMGSRWTDTIEQAKKEGYDGLVYQNEVEGFGHYNGKSYQGRNDSYIPFKSEQIKSAIGNKGTFNPSNPSIIHAPSSTPKGYIESQLSNHILSKKATVGSALQIVASRDKSPFAPLAKYMLANGGVDRLNTPIVHSPILDRPTSTVRSHYDPIGGNGIIRLAGKDLGNHYVITHEAAHALTSKFIDANTNHPLIQGLDSLRRQTEGLLGKSDYATKNVHEFLAEALGNEKFQQKLDSIKLPNDGNKSIWNHVVDFVKNILGIPQEQTSLLDKALRTSDELIKTANGKEISNGSGVPREAPPSTNKQGKDLETTENQMGFASRAFRALTDKIADLKYPATKDVGGSQEVSDAFKLTHNERDQIYGRTANPILEAGKKLSDFDKKQIQKAQDYESLNGKSGTFLLKNQAQRNYWNIERSVYNQSGKEQLASGEPVMRNGKPTSLIQDPFGHYTTMAPKVSEIIKSQTDTKAIDKLNKDFIDNAINHGYSPEQAKAYLDRTNSAIQGTAINEGGNMQYYAGVRREQGLPLPESWRRSDLLENAEAYWRRRATDRAFYNNVESNPRVWSALGNKTDAWNRAIPVDDRGGIAGNLAVQKQLKEFQGDVGGAGDHVEKAASSAATGALISWPGLEGHVALGNIVGLTPYSDNPIQLVRMLSSAVKNMGSSMTHMTENGVVKLSAKSLGQSWDSNKTFAENLQNLANTYRVITSLNNVGHKYSTALMQGAMEWKLPNTIDRANKGSTNDQNYIKKLDPNYTVGKEYDAKGINQLASLASAYISGTHDGRTMPGWMTSDSEVSGFFKLAHWSIAQTNRFMSDVYAPATKGNIAPLVNSLFGVAVGGYIIKQLREELSGKKGQIPSLQEINASEGGLAGHPSLVAYNMIAAAQYAGFAGLLSQVAKYPFDYVYKNRPQGATFPLDQIASDTVDNLKNISSAIANDPNINWLSLASEFGKHVATTDFQMGRMMYNQGVNSGVITGNPAEKKMLIDKLGQLRRFDEMQGLPYNEEDTQSNPYMNLEQKRFRNTYDLKDAVQQVPSLINNIIQTYHDKPDVMMNKLKALKVESYSTFPSMENAPLSFMKYIAYLGKEEGPEKAQSELMDYLRHNAINKAKSSMVP